MSAGIDEILIAAATEYALSLGMKTAVAHRNDSLTLVQQIARKVFRRRHHAPQQGFVEVKRRVGLWYWYHLD